MREEAVQTLEDQGGRVGFNREECAEGWVEDVWVEVFVEAEAEGGAAADQSHGFWRFHWDNWNYFGTYLGIFHISRDLVMRKVNQYFGT